MLCHNNVRVTVTLTNIIHTRNQNKQTKQHQTYKYLQKYIYMYHPQLLKNGKKEKTGIGYKR